MIVYRYATKDEVENILSENLSSVGSVYRKMECNTHRYKEDVKYLHFFKKITGIEDIKKNKNNSNETYYICRFDIPLVVLMLGRGVGYYDSSGYDKYIKTQVEYIIPVENIKSQWLKDYKIDTTDKTSEIETAF